MTTYLSRSAWTTTTTSGTTLTGSQLVGVAVHWPGTTQSVIGVQSQSATASRLRGYRDFHVNSRGWRDVGYNFAIDQAGRVWMLRSTSWAGNRVGAHCASSSNPDANHKYVGVLLILGQSEQPSAAMIEAFGDWYHTRFLPVWKGRTDVRGHGQVPGAQTNCPGTRAKARIADGTLASKPTQEDDMTPAEAEAVFEKVLAKKRGEYISGTDVRLSSAGPARYSHMGLQAVQANGRQLGQLAGQVAGLTDAVAQLAAAPGQPVDLEAVKAAAQAGAEEALNTLDVTIGISPGGDAEPEP